VLTPSLPSENDEASRNWYLEAIAAPVETVPVCLIPPEFPTYWRPRRFANERGEYFDQPTSLSKQVAFWNTVWRFEYQRQKELANGICDGAFRKTRLDWLRFVFEGGGGIEGTRVRWPGLLAITAARVRVPKLRNSAELVVKPAHEIRRACEALWGEVIEGDRHEFDEWCDRHVPFDRFASLGLDWEKLRRRVACFLRLEDGKRIWLRDIDDRTEITPQERHEYVDRGVIPGGNGAAADGTAARSEVPAGSAKQTDSCGWSHDAELTKWWRPGAAPEQPDATVQHGSQRHCFLKLVHAGTINPAGDAALAEFKHASLNCPDAKAVLGDRLHGLLFFSTGKGRGRIRKPGEKRPPGRPAAHK
jgi:hypothetical protein